MELALAVGIVGIVLALGALIGTIFHIVSARKWQGREEKAREKREEDEKKRFAATSDMLEKIGRALNVGRTHEVKLVQDVNLSFQNLVSTAESTQSGWSPQDTAWLGGKMRTFNLAEFPEITKKALEEGKKDYAAGSDKSSD